MLLMQDNFFLRFLIKQEDKKYYYAALLFERFAEDAWIQENNRYNVKHGYSHICQVLHNITKILEIAEEEVIDSIGAEYIFILLSSIYVHDVGMQRFYEKKLPHLAGRNIFSIYELNEIRVNHSMIISNAITYIENITDAKVFFGNSCQKISNFLENENFNINDILTLIINNRRHIAIVSSFHNEPIKNFPFEIERLCVSQKFRRSKLDIDKLILIASLLQVGDALDMSSKRIDTQDFIKKINRDYIKHEMVCEEYEMLERCMLCYIINDVRFELNKDDKQIDIYMDMSLPNANLTDNYDFIINVRRKYSARLKRSDGDPLTIIQNAIGCTINLHIDEVSIEVDNNKDLISDTFFHYQCKHEPNTETLISPKLTKLSELTGGLFLYLKLYSPITDTFFGGHAICKDYKDRMTIMNTFFSPEDFKFNASVECIYVSNLSEVTPNPRLIVPYTKYLRICKKYSVESEIYYVIRHGATRIGYVNLHFESKLDQDTQDQYCETIHHELYRLGFDIVQLHRTDMSSKFARWINTFEWISDEHQKALISLFHNKYDEIPISLLGDIKAVSLAEIKKILEISEIKTQDQKFSVTMHKSLFQTIIEFIIKELSLIANFSFSIICDPLSSFIVIVLDVEIMSAVISPDHIDKSVAYLKIMDEVPSDNPPVTELEYLMPLKSLINLFGGKLNIHNVEDDVKLKCEMLLPRRKITRAAITCS